MIKHLDAGKESLVDTSKPPDYDTDTDTDICIWSVRVLAPVLS